MQAANVPIDLLHWTTAVLPIVVLLVLLVGFRWQAQEAGPVGMFVAAVLGILVFQSPLRTLAVAGGKGVWDAIFILYVVWTALLLYHVIKRAGGFAALQEGIQEYTDNELFLVLAFGWVFASFLQGIAGFGTPIAVVAPLLLAIGMRPVYAVAIPLIGHAWANMFGTLAVGWLATIQVVDLANLTETAVQTGILLWIPTLMAGFTIAWLYGRMPAVRHSWPMILVVSLIHGGLQLVLMPVTPILSAFIAATVAMVALYPLSRWSRYDQAAEGIDERPAMTDGGEASGGDDAEAEETGEADENGADADEPDPVMGFGMSLFPYVVLTVVAIGVLVPQPVESFLESFEIGMPFPATDTGYGVTTDAEQPYSPFAPLTHPGSFLLASVLAGWGMYRFRGYYDAWSDRQDDDEVEGIWEGMTEDAAPASVAVVSFLVMAQVMEHAGLIEELAWGIAIVSPPFVYAFFSSWIGTLGAFMTSSNTASNIIFAPLQQEAVNAMDGLSEATIIAGQSAGGAVGNAIAPANVVLGTGAVGAVGEEGNVLRITLPWVVAVILVVGGVTILLNGVTILGGG